MTETDLLPDLILAAEADFPLCRMDIDIDFGCGKGEVKEYHRIPARQAGVCRTPPLLPRQVRREEILLLFTEIYIW